MEQLDIGFVEECEPWCLESRFFPSKIGGQPAWLDLQNLPTSKDVECGICGDPCLFLCQIYAPVEDDSQAFHRTLFVFVCKNYQCCKPNNNGNLRVLRSQLPRENPFYPFDPPEERENWRPDIKASKFAKICAICSLLAPNHCGKCKKINYCSRQHQIVHWRAGHKEHCNTDEISEENVNSKEKNSLENYFFPEYEVIIKRDDMRKEENMNEEDEVAFSRAQMKEFDNIVKSGNAGSLQFEKDTDKDLLDMANSEEDEAFAEFITAVEKYRKQVLRYTRGGNCLYISSNNQPTNVPKCEQCNEERQFEFQIMPQLLSYLDFEDHFKSLDWGILAVFTCKKSCTPKSGYVSEFIWKQDIVESKEEDS